MAAQVITQALNLLAEGDILAAVRALTRIEATDKAIAKTKAYKDAMATVKEVGTRAGITRGMSVDERNARVKDAYTTYHAELTGTTKPKATTAKLAGAEDLPPPGGAAGGAAGAEVGGAAASGSTPAGTQPPGSPLPAANAPPKGKGALTGQRVSEALADTAQRKGGRVSVSRGTPLLTPLASSSPLTPGTAALLDDMAAAATKTGTAATSPLLNVASGQVRQRLLASGPLAAAGDLDPTKARLNPAQLRPTATPLGPGPASSLAGRAAEQAAESTARQQLLASAARTAADQQRLLSGLAPVETSSLAAATRPLMDAQAGQVAALNKIAAEGDDLATRIDAIRANPRGILGRAVDPRLLNPSTGQILPLRERLAATGGKAGLLKRGGLAATAGMFLAEPAIGYAEDRGLDPTAASGLRGAATGAGIGATVGSIVPGLGTGLGAAVGGIGGGLIGILSGGGGGSKGDFDEASIMSLPGLSDQDKQGLITEYRFMIAAGIPKKTASAELQSKAIRRFGEVQQQQQQMATALPNIMALQGLTAAYSRPYYDDYRKANDAQRSIAQQMVSSLPESQRPSASAFAEQQYQGNNQTAAAFGQANLLAPAFFLQDALKQNAYSSGQPPLAGLGLSGSFGVQGGGGAAVPDALKQLIGG